MTVKLAKRVLKRWREISEESSEVRLELLLTSRMDPATATDLLEQSLQRVLAAFAADPPHTGEEWEWWPGEWGVARVPEGAMLVGGYKSDGFEEIVLALVEDLDRAGVRGKLDLYQLPEPPVPPLGIGVMETRVRVLGRRVLDGPRDRWAADREALHRVLQAATSWCLEARPDCGVTLQHGAMAPLLVRRCDDPCERLRDVIGENMSTTLRSVGAERFRSVTVTPEDGGVRLVEGGPFLHRAGWQHPVAAAIEFACLVAADAVYAYVQRNPDRGEAESGDAETDRLRGSTLDAIAHEERLAPDAFAIQLLGPGYGGRIPGGDAWHATPLPQERVLLEQVELGPWFDELSIDEAWDGESLPRRTALERARADLASILFSPIAKEERERWRAWELAHPDVRLAEDIVAKVHALPTQPYVGHWDVALVLRDGRVLDDVELGRGGVIVTRVAGEREFVLNPAEIVDVRPAPRTLGGEPPVARTIRRAGGATPPGDSLVG